MDKTVEPPELIPRKPRETTTNQSKPLCYIPTVFCIVEELWCSGLGKLVVGGESCAKERYIEPSVITFKKYLLILPRVF